MNDPIWPFWTVIAGVTGAALLTIALPIAWAAIQRRKRETQPDADERREINDRLFRDFGTQPFNPALRDNSVDDGREPREEFESEEILRRLAEQVKAMNKKCYYPVVQYPPTLPPGYSPACCAAWQKGILLISWNGSEENRAFKFCPWCGKIRPWWAHEISQSEQSGATETTNQDSK